MTEDSRVPAAGQSCVAGHTNEPLLDSTIAHLLCDTAHRYPDRLAAVFSQSGERWHYAQLLANVDTLACALHELGLVKGDRLGIWAPNCPEWLLAQFATARLGVILVNINPAYRLVELEYALNKVGCKALITAEQFKTSNYVDMLQQLAPELNRCEAGQLRAKRLPTLRTIIKTGTHTVPGMFCFSSFMNRESQLQSVSLDAITRSLDSSDPINIQFTSGTTGLPKGATLTHHNIVNNAHFVTRAMEFTEQDRLCIPVPFYHCFGMVMGTLGCVSKGAAMIIPSEGFEPEATLRALSEEHCTALYSVPTMFVAMLDHANFLQFDLSNLRTGIMAGAPCPIEVMKKVEATMNMRQVTIAYGMTETSPVSFQSSVDDPLDKRVSSVGRVHPHVQVKIIDETGKTVAVGEQGELCTRGYSVMKGYWDDDDKTASSIDAQGWMHTGDLATLDEQGYCNITGRVKDMIVRGGENVYPREIEEYLYSMPGVAQVQVFGIPDDRLGEVVCAWLVAREGAELVEEQVRAFCQDQIAHYKVPTVVRIVDNIPMTVTGKAQKFIMRKQMVEQLGLQEVETA